MSVVSNFPCVVGESHDESTNMVINLIHHDRQSGLMQLRLTIDQHAGDKLIKNFQSTPSSIHSELRNRKVEIIFE